MPRLSNLCTSSNGRRGLVVRDAQPQGQPVLQEVENEQEQANWKLKWSDGKRKTKSDSTELEFRLQGDRWLDQHARSTEVAILLKTKLNLFVTAMGYMRG